MLTPLAIRSRGNNLETSALTLRSRTSTSAVQLLPSLELSAQSVRSSISYEESGAFAAQPITLLNLFLPLQSRIEEMRPIPRLKVSVYWECKPVALRGVAGPEFTPEDLRGIVELGAHLQVKVIETNEIEG